MALLPLTFIASSFEPAADLPAVFRISAERNPVPPETEAARELLGRS